MNKHGKMREIISDMIRWGVVDISDEILDLVMVNKDPSETNSLFTNLYINGAISGKIEDNLYNSYFVPQSLIEQLLGEG